MDNAFQYMDIIFLAVVAGVVLLRLRSVLGKRTGSEKKDPNLYSYDQPSAQPAEIKKTLKNNKYSSNSPTNWFNNDDFVNGAKGAYEMIVTNFENGNTKELKPLLEDSVFISFKYPTTNCWVYYGYLFSYYCYSTSDCSSSNPFWN